jgi:integrase
VPGASSFAIHVLNTGVVGLIRLRRRLNLCRGLNNSGHSLRAGFVTQAVRNGISESVIQAQTRHRSAEMIAVYRREATPFDAGVGIRIYNAG